MTTTWTVPARCEIFKLIERTISSTDWKPKSKLQHDFIDLLSKYQPIDVIKNNTRGKVSRDYKKINKFLADNGFTIKLDPFDPRENIGFAVILIIMLKWLNRAELCSIENYQGIKMEQGYKILSGSNTKPIIQISTQNTNIKVNIFEPDNKLLFDDYSDLIKKLNYLEIINSKNVTSEYAGVMFPKVKVDVKEDIEYLCNMELIAHKRDKWRVVQALQQTKVDLNETGITVETAVAIQMKLECARIPTLPYLVINKPFILWITHPLSKIPLFVGYFYKDSWINY